MGTQGACACGEDMGRGKGEGKAVEGAGRKPAQLKHAWLLLHASC